GDLAGIGQHGAHRDLRGRRGVDVGFGPGGGVHRVHASILPHPALPRQTGRWPPRAPRAVSARGAGLGNNRRVTDRRDSGFGPWRRGRGGPSRPGDDSVDPAEGRDTPDPQSDTRYGLHGPQYGDTADEYPTEHIRRPIRPRGAPTPPPPPPPPAPGPRR